MRIAGRVSCVAKLLYVHLEDLTVILLAADALHGNSIGMGVLAMRPADGICRIDGI